VHPFHNTELSCAATLAEDLQGGHAVLDSGSETQKETLRACVRYSCTITRLANSDLRWCIGITEPSLSVYSRKAFGRRGYGV
jgi:hypothetical protein